MGFGDRRNKSRKAQVFWSGVAVILSVFCLVWFRHTGGGKMMVVPAAKIYLDLARAGWAVSVTCAVTTVASVLYLPFETSQLYYLGLSLAWAVACVFITVGEALLVKDNSPCPASRQCVGLDEPGMISSYFASVAAFTQFILLAATFFQVRMFKEDSRRQSRRLGLEEGTKHGIPEQVETTRHSSRLSLDPSNWKNLWTAGIKPMEVFADRP